MRITSLNVNRPVADDGAVDETQGSGAQEQLQATTAEAKVELSAPLRPGVGQWDPQLNEQLSNGQQTLAYLNALESRLQELKAELSTKLAANETGNDPQLDAKLQEFANLWQERLTASGGSLDGRLGYSATTPARQRFKIQGLDGNALQSGGKENLAFSVGGIGQRLLVVGVDPQLSEAALARRFDRALAPADIRVAQDEDGGLSFSVPESMWPTVRDTLTVKGAGIRFPNGQPMRVRSEAEPEAIRPKTWRTGNLDFLRRTLHEVLDAIGRIRHARDVLTRALADAHSRLNEPPSPADQEWAASFATDFEALAAQPSYQVYSAIAPALGSITRDRVLSLLALD